VGGGPVWRDRVYSSKWLTELAVPDHGRDRNSSSSGGHTIIFSELGHSPTMVVPPAKLREDRVPEPGSRDDEDSEISFPKEGVRRPVASATKVSANPRDRDREGSCD
jgi:hypothetical protein